MTRVLPWFLLLIGCTAFTWCQGEMGLILPEGFENWDAERVYAFAKDSSKVHTGTPYLDLKYNEIGFEKSKEENHHAESAFFTSQMSRLYGSIGMHDLSLRYSLESFSYSKKSPDLKDDIWALFRLSDAHNALGNVNRALDEAKHSLKLALELDSATTIGWAYNMIGEIYRLNGKADSAKIFYQKGFDTFQACGHVHGSDLTGHNLALSFVDLEEYDRALAMFARPYQTTFENDLSRKLEEGLAIMKIKAGQDSVDAAIAHGKELLQVAVEANMLKWEALYRHSLSGLYRQGAQWEDAWFQKHKADSLDKTLSGERIQLQTDLLEKQFELALVSAEKDLLLQQSRNERLFSIAVIAISALLLFIALLLVTNNRKSRRTNRELAERNELLDELLMEKDTWMNLMAHDLKAPLNAIKGLLKIAENPETPQEVREQVFGHINKAIDKGTELISQLLELAQVESDEFKVNVQPTQLNSLLEEVREAFSSAASNKQIALKMDLPEKEVQLKTDPMIVQRIMENFLSNAIKFSPAHKEVLLGLEQGEGSILLRITDQGPGLSSEDQQNLFQKFKKLSAKPTAGESSTGLGLSIVKELADKLDAKILIDSTVGKGSTFSLAFPYSN